MVNIGKKFIISSVQVNNQIMDLLIKKKSDVDVTCYVSRFI